VDTECPAQERATQHRGFSRIAAGKPIFCVHRPCPLHRCICAHARAHMHFFAESMHSFTGVVSTMHVQGCTLDRCCEHQRTHLLHVRHRMCIYAHVCAVCFISRRGNEDGGVQLVYESTCCLAWVVIFDRRKDRGVVCVFSIFKAGGSVCGCMCVYTRTHTHTTQMGYSDVSPGVRMRHLGGPKNPDGSSYIHSYMCTKYTCVCIC